MDKNIVIVSAYCPDKQRLDMLYKLINDLQNLRETHDLLITSHTIIPQYILDKVDYYVYDRHNDLITDINLINRAWFSPFEGLTILSNLISNYSTYLAVYRTIIPAFNFAKGYGYVKAHHIEYDTEIKNLDEIHNNDVDLDEVDSIVYTKEYKNFESNIDLPLGSVFSFRLDKLNDIFLNYDEEKLLDILKSVEQKTNERTTRDILLRNGNTQKVKDIEEFLHGGNKIALSNQTEKEKMSYWTVPYYDSKDDKIKVVMWNNKDETPIDVKVITNDTDLIFEKGIEKFGWRIKDIGQLSEVDKILILVNNNKKLDMDFSKTSKEEFILNSCAIYD